MISWTTQPITGPAAQEHRVGSRCYAHGTKRRRFYWARESINGGRSYTKGYRGIIKGGGKNNEMGIIRIIHNGGKWPDAERSPGARGNDSTKENRVVKDWATCHLDPRQVYRNRKDLCAKGEGGPPPVA